jgi:CheY-like chemotaxis protein
MDRPLRVLVADNRESLRTTLRVLLHVLRHEVREAGDAYAALGLSAMFLPDVALISPVLPGLDGFEVARRLRRIPGLEGLLLVAVTSHRGPGDDARLRAACFHHCLVEPFDPNELEQLLGAYWARG